MKTNKQPLKSVEEKELEERIKRTHQDCDDCRNWSRICELKLNALHSYTASREREVREKQNARVKEYKDEGVMFILKIEDGKTYEASMPIPKWAEVGKVELRTSTPDVTTE